MGAKSGSAFTSVPSSFFEGSNYSGSNCSVKSREGTSSSKSSNHDLEEQKKLIYGERDKLLNSEIYKIYIGIEPIGNKVGHFISNGISTIGIKNFLPTYLGGSTFVYHASCFLKLSTLESNEGIIFEYGGYCGGDKTYENYIHYAQEDGMRFSRMTFDDYKKKIHNGLKGSQIIDNLSCIRMRLQSLIDKCISTSEKQWRKDDYNLSSYNCQDFVAKVIDVLDVTRYSDDDHALRHNYSLSIYPPIIVKALEENEKQYDRDLNLMIKIESIPIIGAISSGLGNLIYKNFHK